ncbi:MAG: hypothetical protein ACT4QE_10255 [Anaerolineales bacterium]
MRLETAPHSGEREPLRGSPAQALLAPAPSGLWARWRSSIWASSRSPIVRQEGMYWDHQLGGRWRLEEAFALATLANLCLLPVALLVFPWLLGVYALFDEALSLLMTMPAALLIVREREHGTWSILRSTPADATELAAGKLAGLLSLVWEGATYLTRARWYGTLLALPLFALMLTLENPFPIAASQPAWPVFVGLLLAYATFVYRPLIHVLFSGALGLMLSTTVRTSAEALTMGALASAALLTLASGLLVLFVTQHGGAALFSDSVLAGRMAQVFMWLIPLAGLSLLRLMLVPMCFAVAVLRIRQLSE